MEDENDEIPAKCGRPFRKVAHGYEHLPKRDNTPTCSECPLREKNGWCRIAIELTKRDTPCCRYGLIRIRAERQAKRRETNFRQVAGQERKQET